MCLREGCKGIKTIRCIYSHASPHNSETYVGTPKGQSKTVRTGPTNRECLYHCVWPELGKFDAGDECVVLGNALVDVCVINVSRDKIRMEDVSATKRRRDPSVSGRKGDVA